MIGESVQSNMMLPSDKSENTRKRGHEAIRDSDEEATEPYVELNGLGWDEEEWELEGEQSEPEETLPLSTEQTKESAAAVSG